MGVAQFPSTRIEDERIGAIADDVKDNASDVAQEAVEHGKQVAMDVAHSAVETAGEGAAHDGEALRGTAQEHVGAVVGEQPRTLDQSRAQATD